MARVGDRHARLLAGPGHNAGAESLLEQDRRLGPIADFLGDGRAVLDEARLAGVAGRGGAAFPIARKLEAADRSPGVPLVVVNASEGEPGSCKDHVLLRLRPHLILDGAVAAAAACGADAVLVYTHGRHPALERALAERGGRDPVPVRLVDAPPTYLAGESSALASFLDGGPALPRAADAPLAVSGVGRRPTVVSNAETLAHLALVARHGAEWYQEAGSSGAPGSTLVTLTGEVDEPGSVLEIVSPVPFSAVLGAGGWTAPPRAILVGGYAGVWVDGWQAWRADVDRAALAASGVGLGCGLVGVIGHTRCGLAETARLAAWLNAESAGQCGPCAFGMPRLAETLMEITQGRAAGRTVRRLHELTASITDRGLCHLPDGAASLVESAVVTFADELREHRRRGRCKKDHRWAVSPFPLERVAP